MTHRETFRPRFRQSAGRSPDAPSPTGRADAIAIDALSFLAADGDRLDRFMAITGLSAGSVREAASQPGFLAGVLDYICADERLLIAFGENSGLGPAETAKARRALGEAREWLRHDKT